LDQAVAETANLLSQQFAAKGVVVETTYQEKAAEETGMETRRDARQQ
jgi:hypothetical protein